MLSEISVFTKAVCGTSTKKAFDFNGKVICQWIISNNYHNYIPRKPTKLNFKFETKNGAIILTFMEVHY